MTHDIPPRSQDICQRLLRGYQFSLSDSEDSDNLEGLYAILDAHFAWFQRHLAAIGLSLVRDGDVIFLEDEQKELSNEEKQTVVVLFLLVDLWLERGKAYGQLFDIPVSWADLDWLRDGYGREYLAQVGIEDLDQIESLFGRLERKGLVDYRRETRTIRLRKPAERLITIARRIHQQMRA
jgi:hypothetical protein